ncbi:MAG: hypothetical protein DAHOPDDO_00816 [Ignavibacteriaceae bacterium]|nr:hypothetical protein [Ignavibacteriaceae bacterium]
MPTKKNIVTPKENPNVKVVFSYFKHIEELRRGNEAAVNELMNLWDEQGIFEFAGFTEVTGTFIGTMAINTLYRNRLLSSHMPIMLEGLTKSSKTLANLEFVGTEVKRMADKDNKVIVSWLTSVTTSDKRGFDMVGSHAFSFSKGKIKNLKVTISKKPLQSKIEGISIKELKVKDIGRLALAAWPVV